MSSTWPTLSSIRSSFQICQADGLASCEQPIGVDEGEVTDQDRHALAEPTRLARPALGGVPFGEHGVRRGLAATAVCVVHDVVVEEGEGVHQLERRAGIGDDLSFGVAAGGDVAPRAERGA